MLTLLMVLGAAGALVFTASGRRKRSTSWTDPSTSAQLSPPPFPLRRIQASYSNVRGLFASGALRKLEGRDELPVLAGSGWPPLLTVARSGRTRSNAICATRPALPGCSNYRGRWSSDATSFPHGINDLRAPSSKLGR